MQKIPNCKHLEFDLSLYLNFLTPKIELSKNESSLKNRIKLNLYNRKEINSFSAVQSDMKSVVKQCLQIMAFENGSIINIIFK